MATIAREAHGPTGDVTGDAWPGIRHRRSPSYDLQPYDLQPGDSQERDRLHRIGCADGAWSFLPPPER